MGNIKVAVSGNVATNLTPAAHIVCGNSEYTVTFEFDDEWEEIT